MKLFGFEIRKAEKRDGEQYVSYSNVLPFGKSYTTNNAMNLSAVYRATEIISDNIAILPIKVKSKSKEHFDELTNHPLNYVFSNGIDTLSKYNFMKLLIQSVILKGNGFAYIERNNGQVTGLRFLPSNDVTIDSNSLTNVLRYRANQIKGIIEPKDMIHLVKNSWNGVEGVSILAYAKRIIDTANSTENSAKSFFSNGCNLAGIITVQGQLTEKQKQDIRTNWVQTYNGSDTNGCLLGVMQGNMKYEPIQINATDAQMLESRQFNIQDIARFFGISPILLGDLSNSSYSTLEASQQEFILHTLQPYIEMVEDEFTRKLSNDDNIKIELDSTVILKTDKTAVANYYTQLLTNGILCVNEVREELGYAPIEGGDKHIIPYTDVNMNTINNDDNNE